jgi:hypothetical protein
MGLRDRLEASLRGEVSTADLVTYASSNQDAYDLVDELPTQGVAALAAWCAFVLQTHADNLLGSGSTPGHCVQPAYEEARVLIQLAAAWLERARSAQSSERYRLDVAVPQPYPRPYGEFHVDELRAMRKTLEAVEARAGTAIEGRRGEPIYERLQPTLGIMRAALDAALVLSRGRTPEDTVEAALVQSLHAALDRGYQAGQLLAMPELVALPTRKPPPSVLSPASLAVARPGDPMFDPWCLTDPIERRRLSAHRSSSATLDEFWKSYPHPEQLLAVQAEILSAREAGTADYLLAADAGSLRQFTAKCPWPGAFLALSPIVVGGQALDEGDRFLLSAGGGEEPYRCVIVRLSARVAEQLLAADEEARSAGAPRGKGLIEVVADGLSSSFDVLPLL